MANLGYVSSFNINGNELSLKDAALTEIVNEIIEAIGANNGDISDRINNLHERSFDALIKISSQNDSEIASIQDGMYKIQYVTVTGEGDDATETLNNSAILIQKGTNQYLYKDGQISSRTKTDSTWSNWITFEGGVTSVNGQTGAVTLSIPDDSNLVHKTGNETIQGIKKFNNNTKISTIIKEVSELIGDNPTASFNWIKVNGVLTENEYTLQQALDARNNLVTSVNGMTGAVTVNVPVTSVNGQTGAVNITIPTKTSDLTNDSNFTTLYEVQTEIVGAAPEQLNTLAELADALNDDQNFASTVTNLIGQKYTKPSTGIPASDLADGVIPDVPVTSVNGQTGAVTVNVPVTSVNGQTGAVTIDTGVTSFNGATGAITYTAPVTSVNGQTGTVTLNIPDAQVNADWNASTGVQQILNAPIDVKKYDPSGTGNIQGIRIENNYIKLDASNHIEIGSSNGNGIYWDEAGDVGLTLYSDSEGMYLDSGAGVSLTTTGNNKFYYNNKEVAVKDDIKVTSVNGQTGAVTIDTGVTSFNGATGAITYTAPVTSVNGQTGAVTIDHPVTSVNGAIGAVVTSLSSNYASATGVNEALQLASGDTYEQAFGKLEKAIVDNEEVVANSLQNLNNTVSGINNTVNNLQIPQNTSDLYNDSNYLASGDNISELNNNAGYLTLNDISSAPAYGITSADITNWNTAYTNNHTHSNKSVLDGISASDITNWNNKLDSAPVQSVNGQTGAVTITETQLSKGTATGAGNAVTDITVSNHQITLVKGATYATQTDIDNSIAALVDSAPGTLDTLNELAAALGDDPNFATTIAGQIGAKYTKPSTGIPASDLANDVQTNLTLASTALQSFTETDPTVPSHVKNITSQDITNWNNKLSSAPVTSVNGQTGAVSLALGDTNVIETIKVNNTALTPVSKAVNITVPTKVSDLTNDLNLTSNVGTITGITMNGVSKGTSGVVDLGTVLTSHQDISGKVDKVTGMGLSSNDYTTTEKNKLAGINIGSLDSLTTAELNSIFS